MIQSKNDYIEYIAEDRKSCGNPSRRSITWKYLKTLRRAELYHNLSILEGGGMEQGRCKIF